MKARPSEAVARAERIRVAPGEARSTEADWLAREEPLEIRVRGKSIAVTMRTPGHDAELAAGFLVSEGLIQHRDDLIEIAHCEAGENAHLRNIINVFLSPRVTFDFEKLSRHVFGSSSCGVCGKASIEAIQQQFPPIESGLRIGTDVLSSLPGKLRKAQEAFARTGGIHAAAVFTGEGELVTLHEDVGRHNAVDKVIGDALLNGRFPLAERILLVSGRSSFEIMQKALAARIAVVAAISAPSSLAVEFARENGQTLAGFLRGESFNLYSGAERIDE